MTWNTLRVEDALVRFVAIAEEFTHGLLLEVTTSKLPPDDRVSSLWESHVDRETDTWAQRIHTWKLIHAVSIKGFERYDVINGFVEARNSIVHGLGLLTRKQLKNRERSVGRLRAAGIALSGDRLELASEDAERCALTVRGLIRWLDDAAASVA